MEDLVGVGVSDPGEEPRVREGALQGVVLPRQGRAKSGEIGLEHLEAAAPVFRHSLLSPHQVERGSFLRAGLGQEEHAVGKVEGRERSPRRQTRDRLLPVEAAGDHEVED